MSTLNRFWKYKMTSVPEVLLKRFFFANETSLAAFDTYLIEYIDYFVFLKTHPASSYASMPKLFGSHTKQDSSEIKQHSNLITRPEQPASPFVLKCSLKFLD